MKKLLVLFTIFLSIPTMANPKFESMSKEELAEYEIIVVKKSKDGSSQEVGRMSRAEYKVVKLGTSNEQKIKTETRIEVEKERASEESNTVILSAGVGHNGLHVDSSSPTHVVHEKSSAVGGLTYCRNQGNKGICATGLTNETFMLGVKLDFK